MSWGLSINLDTVLLLPSAPFGAGLIEYDLIKAHHSIVTLGGQASEPVLFT